MGDGVLGKKLENKDDISVLTNSFHEMSKTIISQKKELINEINCINRDLHSYLYT